MKDLYLKIQSIIESVDFRKKLTKAGLPPFRYYDFYNEQYIMPEDNEVLITPALLFEFVVTNETALINLHICLGRKADSSTIGKNQSASLQVFNFARVLDLAVDKHIETVMTGRLSYTGESLVIRNKLNVYILSYQCQYNRPSEENYELHDASDAELDPERGHLVDKNARYTWI